MYALEMNEEEVEQHIYNLLNEPLTASGNGKVAIATK
jgi:hypothetical protein